MADRASRARKLRALPSTRDDGDPNVGGLSSVVKESENGGWASDYIITAFAMAEDNFPAWGMSPYGRDRELRMFWPTEPLFASALFNVIEKYVAFDFSIQGPPSQADSIMEMFMGCEFGKGWEHLMVKSNIDFFVQDNGAWIEIVREEDDMTAPVLSLNHLDTSRCVRTGRRDIPIRYMDQQGGLHDMKWYQVIERTEMPSPLEVARGMQYCALTRMLRAALIAKAMSVYTQERISGNFTKEIHFVGGVPRKIIEQEMALQANRNLQQGRVAYTPSLVIGGLDPTAKISKETVTFASLPEGFDYEKWCTWYLNQFALALGQDPSEFIPSMGHGLGNQQGGTMQHLKARGKGAAYFMRSLEHQFNYQGVMPRTCKFTYSEQDNSARMEAAEVRKAIAQELQVLIMSGLVTEDVARKMALDLGVLSQDQFNEVMADPDRPMMPPQKFPGGPAADGGPPSEGGAPFDGGGRSQNPQSISPAGGHQPKPSSLRKMTTGAKEHAIEDVGHADDELVPVSMSEHEAAIKEVNDWVSWLQVHGK